MTRSTAWPPGAPWEGCKAMAQRELLDDCVHCGFCLPHCPTYQSWSEEMDSPRGRIDLMKGLRDGKVAAHLGRGGATSTAAWAAWRA